MTNDQETTAPRRGVSLRQIATVLQDFGYRGLVDEDSNCVHSAAMGLDFRVVLYGLIDKVLMPTFNKRAAAGGVVGLGTFLASLTARRF